jgi:hypothetical protein
MAIIRTTLLVQETGGTAPAAYTGNPLLILQSVFNFFMLDEVLQVIPPTIERDGKNFSFTIRWSFPLQKWVCYYGNPSPKRFSRWVKQGRIGFGSKPHESVIDLISKQKKI